MFITALLSEAVAAIVALTAIAQTTLRIAGNFLQNQFYVNAEETFFEALGKRSGSRS